MRFEAALAMNVLAYVKEPQKRQQLTDSIVNNMVILLKDYMTHKKGISYLDLSRIKTKLAKLKMPYPLDYKCKNTGNCAIEYNGHIYLFYTYQTSNQEIVVKAHLTRLWGVKQEHIKICGVTLNYTYCDLSRENANILRLTDWDTVFVTKKFTKLVHINKKELDPRLFPYQVKGIQMLCSGYRLLGDEQGLGKTGQTLQFIQYEGIRPVLICCPATLKLNWLREILMWTNTTKEKVTIIEGTNPYPIKNRFVIINYDLLPYWERTLVNTRFSLVVCDECHYIQNEEAKRTKAFLNIASHIPDRLFISGTPFTSRPFQMYTALHMIAPDVFGNAYGFGMKFCNPTYYKGNVNFTGATNTDILHDILSDGICIRRLKKDVLEELPDKMRVTVPIGLSADEVKKSSVYKPIYALEQKIKSSKDALGTLEYQRQIAYLRKRDAVNDWISDFLESGKKLVVFGVHTATLDAVEAAFPDISVRIDGSTPNKLRDKNVQKFQNDPNCRLFIGNVQAAGTGITLTAASDAVFIECGWVASQLLQAEDRIHRIGAKNACTIYYMAVPDTIDEKIIDIVNYKAKMHTKIFDESSDSMLEDLRKASLKYKPLFTD